MNDEVTVFGKLGRAVRRLLVVAFVAGLGFAGGLYFSYQRSNVERQALTNSQQSTERRLADLKTATAAEIADLEKQVLEAQKTELERALVRAKRGLAVDEAVESLAAASVDVEARNFGRALERIDQISLNLEGMGPSTDVRAELEGLLDEIRTGLEQLDPSVRARITSLARDLEQGFEVSGLRSTI